MHTCRFRVWSRAMMHILMLGYFTLMLPVTTPLALLLFKNAMKMQRSENMVNELGTLTMEFSLHWSLLLLLVAWGHEATVFYRCLTDLLATYWGKEYKQ